MLAAQTLASEDSIATTLLGFGMLAVFCGVLLALHIRRWRRRGVAPRLRRMLSRLRTSIAPVASPATADRPAAGATSAPVPPTAQPVTNTPASGPPAARHSPETLEPLAERVDRSRRLAIFEDRVAAVLARLPRDHWTIDRYVLIGGARIPFLVLGPTGVFTIWPVDGAHGHTDPSLFNGYADVIKRLLPGYTGAIGVAITQAPHPDAKPEWSYSVPANAGVWVVGANWLIWWLEHFKGGHALGAEDVRRFNELAGPHWERRAKGARVPAEPRYG
jgi:hypothetical protein